MDIDSSNILPENILMDSHCLSPCTCKRYIVYKQFDGLNFDSLARKHQNVKILHYMVYYAHEIIQ